MNRDNVQLASGSDYTPVNLPLDTRMSLPANYGDTWETDRLIADNGSEISTSLPDIYQMTNDLEYFFESFGQPGDNGGISVDFGLGNASGNSHFDGNTDEVSRLIQGFM